METKNKIKNSEITLSFKSTSMLYAWAVEYPKILLLDL